MESSNLKVLAIDDNPDHLTALKAAVQDLLPGCTVLAAVNGTSGIATAHAEDPDVIKRPAAMVAERTRDLEQSRQAMLSLLEDLIAENEARKQTEQELRTSLRERETLLKEVHHRVKNNLQIIHSLISLQARQDQTPAVVEAFRTMQNRVRSMAMLHEALYGSEDLARIDFHRYVERMCVHLAHAFGADAAHVQLETRVSSVMLPLDRAVPCGLLINELVTNVLKHAFPDGRSGRATIALEFETDRQLLLTVADDGVGLPDTLDLDRAKSLGLELVRGLTQQLEGTLRLDRGSPGTIFRVTFPAP